MEVVTCWLASSDGTAQVAMPLVSSPHVILRDVYSTSQPQEGIGWPRLLLGLAGGLCKLQVSANSLLKAGSLASCHYLLARVATSSQSMLVSSLHVDTSDPGSRYHESTTS